MTRRLLLWLLVCLPAACNTGEKRDSTQFTGAADRSLTSSYDTAAPPAPVVLRSMDTVPTSRLPDPPIMFPLTPVPGASVRTLHGTARLTTSGTSTVIAVQIESSSGGNYDGAIVQGTCTAPGAQVTELTTISVDSIGRGRSVSYSSLPIDRILSAPHALVFGTRGRIESCGSIPGPAS